MVRTALYLDFDNVFSGLLQLDPDVAMQFAQEPGGWLGRLSTELTVDGPRRWLVVRCYMNPSGSVPDPQAAGGPRLYFSRFRPFFVNAGFEVIDCPPLGHTKNAADIRMVVDAVDALGDRSTTYEEFVIASGDSDMTPLLVRLRRSDRRTTILSPSDAVAALRAVADRLVNGQQLLELVQGEQVELDDDTEPTAGGRHYVEEPVTGEPTARRQAFEQFRAAVTKRYTEATGPLNLASLAQELRGELGPSVENTNWFGFGGFMRAVDRIDLPGLHFSQHWMWDQSRHDPPDLAANETDSGPLPEPVERLTSLLNLPRLPSESWPAVYQVLSDYAGSHRFNLTQATRWCRDRLADQGFNVSRSAVGFVMRGTAFGGCPLYRQPTPTAAEIGDAFVANVLNRAEAAAVPLTTDETDTVRAWLGA